MTARFLSLQLFASGLALAATAGCTQGLPQCTQADLKVLPVQYALVEYRGHGEVGQSPPTIEINQTPGYLANRSAYKSVAIRLPDTCLQTAASAMTGASRAGETQTILSTYCGVYLSELERALTTNGYRVFSWDALRGLERQKNLAPYAAGKELGADIVFVFNSLDAAPVLAGSQTNVSFKYFVSDAKGTRGQPFALDDASRSQFREFAKSQAGTDDTKQVVALSATLDSTAIITSGGESVWFYRRTVTQPVPGRRGMRFLFGRVEGGPWAPAQAEAARVMGAIAPPPQVKTEDVSENQVSGAAADPYAAEKLALIRDAAKDFVSKFQSGAK